MTRTLLFVLVILFCALHQDFWFWRSPRPLLFGALPPGLWYHALYTLAASGVLYLLVRAAWPAHLEDEIEHRDPKR